MKVFPFIEAEKAQLHDTVKRSCQLLKVSRSAFHEPSPDRRPRSSGPWASAPSAATRRSQGPKGYAQTGYVGGSEGLGTRETASDLPFRGGP